jgi:translation initiation factor IF-3
MAYIDQGKEVLTKFANELSDVADVEEKPSMNGRVMSMLLAPKNK